MKAVKDCPLFSHNDNVLHEVRKAYNLHQPGRIDESIDLLQEWIQAQPHFNKKDFDRDYLENFLINNKGSVEKTKKGLENNFIMKTYGKQSFIFKRPIDMEELNNLKQVVLPKATKDHCRIIVNKNTIRNYSDKIVQQFSPYSFFFCECLLKYTYTVGMILVADYREADLAKMIYSATSSPKDYIFDIFLKAYQWRVKQIHVIVDSKLIEIMLQVAKTMFSEKLVARVFVHKNLESLYDYIDKDLLPSDYGGKEKHLDELWEDYNKFISTDYFMDHMEEMLKATIDSKKKPKDNIKDLCVEMQGSFRTLEID